MDLQKELDEIKALLNAILKIKEPRPLTEEECKRMREISESGLAAHKRMREISEASLAEHNLANE